MYEGREVHVSNVDWKASEGDLKELFSKYGAVELVRIPRKVDGGSKGFGYVVFSSQVGTLQTPDISDDTNMVGFTGRSHCGACDGPTRIPVTTAPREAFCPPRC